LVVAKRKRAASAEDTGAVRCERPQTGAEYLESLRDGREVYIYGQRVEDVTKHPAFRNGWTAPDLINPDGLSMHRKT
jgi:4-hydroxyphenylacetate 3-monooxygenase